MDEGFARRGPENWQPWSLIRNWGPLLNGPLLKKDETSRSSRSGPTAAVRKAMQKDAQASRVQWPERLGRSIQPDVIGRGPTTMFRAHPKKQTSSNGFRSRPDRAVTKDTWIKVG